MYRNRGILYLADPQSAGNEIRISNAKALVFDENGRHLSRAQDALWQMRRQYEWVCVAAEGNAAYVALALAAQLPVDRLALQGGWLHRRDHLDRRMNRIRAYARRNLSLVVAEVLLFDAADDEISFLSRLMRHAKICAAEGKMDDRLCLESWDALPEKNLPIQGNCV